MIAFRRKRVSASWAVTSAAAFGTFFIPSACGNAQSDRPQQMSIMALKAAIEAHDGARRTAGSVIASQVGFPSAQSVVSASSLLGFSPGIPIFDWDPFSLITTNTPIVDAFVVDDSAGSPPPSVDFAADATPAAQSLLRDRIRAEVSIERSTAYDRGHNPTQTHNQDPGAAIIFRPSAQFHLKIFLDNYLYTGEIDDVKPQYIAVRLCKRTGSPGDSNAYQDPPADPANPTGPSKPVNLQDAFPAPTTTNMQQQEFALPYLGKDKYFYLTTDLQAKSPNNNWLHAGFYAIVIKRKGTNDPLVYANFEVQ